MEEEIRIEMKKEAASVYSTLRPTIYASWLLGVGIARPIGCSKAGTIIFRILHFAVCSVIVAYGAIDFFFFGSVFKSDIFKIMYYMNKVVCYVSSYYYVYQGARHYDKWPELIDRIDELDRKIRKEISMDDRPIARAQIFALLATIALGPVSLVSHALYYYFVSPENIFASDLLLYYTIAQSAANSFMFDITIYTIARRFFTINDLIGKLDETLPNLLMSRKLRQIRELHSGVCDVISLVNDTHGIQLLLGSANSFTMVVATLFRIYMGVVEKNYAFMVINNVIWIVYLLEFAFVCFACTMACRESNRTGVFLQSIILNRKQLSSHDERRAEDSISTLNEEYQRQMFSRADNERDCVRNEVNDFTSQLQLHRVVFTACDFFEMNNALLSGFVGVITTYLIILVQFYRPENLNVA